MPNPKKRVAEDVPPAPAAKKKNKKRKANTFDDEGRDAELGVNTLFSRMDNQLLADHYLQKLTRFGADLSPVELSDLSLSANAIQDTTSWQETRTQENLADFLEEFTEHPESLSKMPKKKGAPHTLVVASTGPRAANLVRAVRKFSSKDNVVGKLFAKHFKVEEQVSFLQNHRSGIGVGTSTRLADLIENGALSLDGLQRIVVDASHIDVKKHGFLDMREPMLQLARFLARKELKERYGAEKKPVALLFY